MIIDKAFIREGNRFTKPKSTQLWIEGKREKQKEIDKGGEGNP